jgi:hypothetical protein
VGSKFHEVPGIVRLAAFRENLAPAFNLRDEQVAPVTAKETLSVPNTTTLSTERGIIPPVHVVVVFQSPPPVPLLVIVNDVTVKVAVIILFPFIVTFFGFSGPLRSPLQPVNEYPSAGVAVSWTTDNES